MDSSNDRIEELIREVKEIAAEELGGSELVIRPGPTPGRPSLQRESAASALVLENCLVPAMIFPEVVAILDELLERDTQFANAAVRCQEAMRLHHLVAPGMLRVVAHSVPPTSLSSVRGQVLQELGRQSEYRPLFRTQFERLFWEWSHGSRRLAQLEPQGPTLPRPFNSAPVTTSRNGRCLREISSQASTNARQKPRTPIMVPIP